MFDILQDIDDGLFYVYYSGTLVETFVSRVDAEDHISVVMAEMNLPSDSYTFDEPWLA